MINQRHMVCEQRCRGEAGIVGLFQACSYRFAMRNLLGQPPLYHLLLSFINVYHHLLCISINVNHHLLCIMVFLPRLRHGINVIPLPVTCVIQMIQDKQHVLFHCANSHMISLLRKYYAFLFSPIEAHDVITFLSQNNNKLCSFLHELIPFYEQASSLTS